MKCGRSAVSDLSSPAGASDSFWTCASCLDCRHVHRDDLISLPRGRAKPPTGRDAIISCADAKSSGAEEEDRGALSWKTSSGLRLAGFLSRSACCLRRRCQTTANTEAASKQTRPSSEAAPLDFLLSDPLEVSLFYSFG